MTVCGISGNVCNMTLLHAGDSMVNTSVSDVQNTGEETCSILWLL